MVEGNVNGVSGRTSFGAGFLRPVSRVARCCSWALWAILSASCGRTNLSLSYDEAGRGSGGSSSRDAAGGSDSSKAVCRSVQSNAAGGSPSSNAAGGSPSTADSCGLLATGGTNAGGQSGCGARIDDMEDGSGRICTGSGRAGAWYAFLDEQSRSTQWPAAKPAGTPIETSPIPGCRAASRRGMHTYGSANGWGAGIGLDLDFDGTAYHLYDASRYRGVHFWARSNSEKGLLAFRIGTAATTAVKYGGTCESGAPTECVGPTPVNLQLEPDWLEYTVSFTDLPDVKEARQLTNIQFMAKGEFDFWIDDVSFVENEPNCCANQPSCQGGARFSDAAVQAALLSRDNGTGVLSCAQVCTVRSLSLTDPRIQSLSGFECLSALDTLTLASTAVTDLSPLSGLVGLHELSIGQGKLSDLRPLSALSNLRVLNLADNRVADVQALAGMRNLQSLSLTNNSLTDAAPLAKLTALSQLLLAGNQIQDASPVSQLAALSQLELSNNRITSLGKAWQLPLLHELNLDDNQISDVTALGSLTALEQLSLNRNQVKDVSPLAQLGKLARLSVNTNRVETPLGAFSGLPQLMDLDLSHNQITSLGSICGLPKLWSLNLGDNQLVEVDELASLTELAVLNLASNSIAALSGSFAFHGLHFLNLSNNGLSHIPETAFTGSVMNTVLLAHNQLQELKAFSHVFLVPWQTSSGGRNAGAIWAPAAFDVSDNQVRDLAPLLRAGWKDATISASNNPLDCAAQAGNLRALRAQSNTVDVCN